MELLQRGSKMNLSKTSEYAIRILLYLTLHRDRLVTTKELNENLHLSFKYVGRLLSIMTNHGIVTSIRGKNGGYQLGKPSDQLSLIEVIKVVDDWEKYTQCMMGFGECNEENPCAFHDIWQPIRSKLIVMFENTTIQDLLQHIHKKV